MASKRKSVKNLKAKKVSSKKAQQVKGGLLPAVQLRPDKLSPFGEKVSPLGGFADGSVRAYDPNIKRL